MEGKFLSNAGFPRKNRISTMRKDLVNGIVGLTVGAFAYWETFRFDRREAFISENPALYPQLLSIVLCLLSASLVIKAIAGKELQHIKANSESSGIWRMMKVVISLVGYSVGIYLFGFILPSLLFMYIMPLQLGTSKRTALLVSAPLTIALYVTFFLLFKVPIPHGVVFG